MKEGFGIYTWTDGRQYRGWWFKGKQHGYGAYIGSNLELKHGIWDMGKRTHWLSDEDMHEIN